VGDPLNSQPPTGTVTLMFTDIVDSTALRDTLVEAHGGSDGNRLYRERFLGPHNERIGALLREHHGFEVKTIGDSFLIAFAEAEDAVRCAVAIQRSLRDEPIADAAGKSLAVRIGMHTGAATLVTRDGKYDYDSDAVNIAARVEGLLKGGQRIYCSGETKALAKTAPGLRYHSYGSYQLKGVSERIEIFDVLWDDAMQPAPPPQPHERLPNPWLTSWVGREREMTLLEEALRADRLVTLHGTGGVGKTRLAIETLLARGAGLPRELVFVSLETKSDTPEGLLGALRDALGLTEVDAADFDALCRQLHGTERLLLLDNFESVMSAAGFVPRVAATPGVRVLVTSQRALEVPGERVVDLEPMETKTKDDLTALESYRLFVGLAQQRDRRWQPNDDVAMREVLIATDGLPYLIELVAAVASKRQLQHLAADLKTRLKDVRARHVLAERHASVQACLEWALERLPAEEREALPRLAVFAGGFDDKAALGVAETPLPSLDVLVDASLLRFDRETGRYSVLATTRQFAGERLAEDEQAKLAGAHARWFIERLDQADDALRAKGGEAQRAARRWIDTEYDNVQQAVGWAEAREPELFARAVWAYGIYLNQTCRFTEDVRLNEARLRRLSLESDPDAWARTQNNLGSAYCSLPTGDRSENVAKAMACFEAALHVWTEREGPAEWATTQNNLGNAYWSLPTGDRSENLTKAIACYEAALRVWTERDFPADWALTQNNLGTAYWRSENLPKAISCYEAALRVRTEREFPADWAMTQNNLGNAYSRSENLAKAIACYEAALRVWTEREFPADWATTQHNLGVTYQEMAAGEPGHNRRQAILCFESAARGYAAVGLTDKAEKARQHAAALAGNAG